MTTNEMITELTQTVSDLKRDVETLKQEIIKESQDYYSATSTEDKEKHKENLKRYFKKFHKFRNSQMGDYYFVKKLIKNII